MAIRKNKKRIDPRYFLHETTYRDLNESPEIDKNIDQISALITKNEIDVSDDNASSDHWNGIGRANLTQGPYEMMLITKLDAEEYKGGRNDPRVLQLADALRKATSHMSYTRVGLDRQSRLGLVTGHPGWQSVDDMVSLATAIAKDILPKILDEQQQPLELDFYKVRYQMNGLPCKRQAPPGYPGWISGVNMQGQHRSYGYALELIQISATATHRNEELIKAALLDAETEKMCKG
jgi:hypothetical protein